MNTKNNDLLFDIIYIYFIYFLDNLHKSIILDNLITGQISLWLLDDLHTLFISNNPIGKKVIDTFQALSGKHFYTGRTLTETERMASIISVLDFGVSKFGKKAYSFLSQSIKDLAKKTRGTAKVLSKMAKEYLNSLNSSKNDDDINNESELNN